MAIPFLHFQNQLIDCVAFLVVSVSDKVEGRIYIYKCVLAKRVGVGERQPLKCDLGESPPLESVCSDRPDH